VSSEFALHTLTNTARLEQLIEANTALTKTISELATQIHAHVCPWTSSTARWPGETGGTSWRLAWLGVAERAGR
jgi:hypothetical protein